MPPIFGMAFPMPTIYSNSAMQTSASLFPSPNHGTSSSPLFNPAPPIVPLQARQLTGGNTFTRKPTPWATEWQRESNCPWSSRLATLGDANKDDSTLFAFMVDCAMKLFIDADLELPVGAHMLTNSELVWKVIRLAEVALQKWLRHEVTFRISINEDALIFLVKLLEYLPRILERCRIDIGQQIRHSYVRMAAYHLKEKDSRWGGWEHSFEDAYYWVYGDQKGFSTGTAVSVWDWLFNHN
jgi:hypothetical protein